MSSTLDRALELVFGAEGGYVNDPDDAGGETKFGISKRSYPHLDIRKLTRAQAAEIYRRDFWEAARCDQLPERIAIAHFDAAVNMGTVTAAKLLQNAAGVTPDGKIGPITLRAVHASNEDKFLNELFWLRVFLYARISSYRNNLKFLKGWIYRVRDLRAALR